MMGKDSQVRFNKGNEYIQFKSNQNEDVYYRLGIIDFLQKYGKRKRLETKYLKVSHRNVPVEEFSCVPPQMYATRFTDFMRKNLFK